MRDEVNEHVGHAGPFVSEDVRFEAIGLLATPTPFCTELLGLTPVVAVIPRIGAFVDRRVDAAKTEHEERRHILLFGTVDGSRRQTSQYLRT